MAFQKGNRAAAKRPNAKNAGRKPKAATILKRRLIENKIEEAEASFAFLVAVRDNAREPTAIRVAASDQILDRVLGKARQTADVNLLGLMATQDASQLSDAERLAQLIALFERVRQAQGGQALVGTENSSAVPGSEP